MRASNIHYELAERTLATNYGGIGLMYQLARESGLIDAINSHLELFRVHLPYHESDHVLNIAFNAFCDGTCLEDIEHRRQDEAYLNALGTERIPDPTTAGDFCRRFDLSHIAAYTERTTRPDRRYGGDSQPSSSPKPRSMPMAPSSRRRVSARKAWTSRTKAIGAIIPSLFLWPTLVRSCGS